jgi:hypothetical protein
MITPEKMTSLEQNKVIEMYAKLNQELTAMIIKKLQQNEEISSYTKAQIRQLARQGGKEIFHSTLKQINGISRQQKKALEELFTEVQESELDGYSDTYKAKGQELQITPAMIALTNSIYRRTLKTFKNMTGTIAFASQKTYVKAIDELYLKVATGSQDYTSAMKQTINTLAEKGIQLESNGRSYKLESVVKMNLMTALTQTANDLSKEVGNIIGANCVVIGHTPHCRPTHQVIDGVIMSIDKFKQYEYLTTEPNCYHIVNYDWRPEFEGKENKVRDNGHLTKAQYEENYNTRQKQNYFARMVRNKKEQVATLNKSDKRTNVTSEELTKAKKELRNAQMKYRTYCKSNNLDVDYNLTWKSGYNK